MADGRDVCESSAGGIFIDARLRDAVFGRLHENVKTGHVSRSEALSVMKRAVDEFFPDCACAFGHGSALTGTYSEYSDLDVIVFLKEGNFFEARCINFEGYPIEMQIYTLDVLDVFMKMSKAAGVSVGMMSGRGEVLVDREDVADALLQKLTAAFHAGPDPAPAAVQATIRMKLTNHIVDLLEAVDDEERVACGLAMFELMSKAKFTALRSWSHTGKWVPRSIGVADGRYFPRLMAGYQGLLDGDAEPLATFAVELLDEIGGPCWLGYRNQIPVMPDLVTGGALAAAATLARA